MRDPNRIKAICALLERAWTAAPDLRLGQLLINAGGISGTHTAEVFHKEDEAWADGLREFTAAEVEPWV